MTILLTADPELPSLFRIAVADSWGSDSATSGAVWRDQPMAAAGRPGFRVGNWRRDAFPVVSRAEILWDYGSFHDGIWGVTGEGTYNVDQPDLRGKFVRIMAGQRVGETDEVTSWSTVWLGWCLHQKDEIAGGAQIPMGTRRFYLVGIIQRAGQWRLDRHGLYHTGPDSATGDVRPAGGAKGHPGYNVAPPGLGDRLVGNRANATYEVNGVSVSAHTPPGVAGELYWDDLQAVQHALASARPKNEPLLTNWTGNTATLSGSISQTEVKHGATALSVAMALGDRKRGRCEVYEDWTDSGITAADPGTVTVQYVVRPINKDDITITPAVGSPQTVTGATTNNTTVVVDLTGDERVVSCDVDDRAADVCDRLVVESERIEVLVTGRVGDGGSLASPQSAAILAPRFTLAQITAYKAASATARKSSVYADVYQAYQLKMGWDGYASDGNGSTSTRCDFRVQSGATLATIIGSTALASYGIDTDSLTTEIAPDLPILDGYDYSGSSPARQSSDEIGTPRRSKIKAWIRTGSDAYAALEDYGSYDIDTDGRTIRVAMSADDGQGTRLIGDTASPNTWGSSVLYTNLVLTFAIVLPWRLEMTFGEATGKRVRYLEMPGYHLWLAHHQAIYDLNGTAGRRGACGGTATTPGILRDDRERFSKVAALAWEWYKSPEAAWIEADRVGTPAQYGRRACTWSLKAEGFRSAFDVVALDGSTTAISYPRIGQLVTSMFANGTEYTLNTPITSESYDAESGVFTWQTEWGDLSYE